MLNLNAGCLAGLHAAHQKLFIMSSVIAVDNATVQEWITARLEPEAIEKDLLLKGWDAQLISAHLKAFRRLRNARKQVRGFICMGVGAFLGFLACVLAIVNPVPGMYSMFLYGLTTFAILIVFLGLYLVFE
jgi:hypothetical protein